MTQPAASLRDLNEQEIREALSYLNASDRDTWLRTAFAVQHELGPDGWSLWNDWSRSGDGYNESDARTTWRSAKAGGNSKGVVTIGSLISEAQAFGFRLNVEDRTPISEEEIKRRKQERDDREAESKRKAEEGRSKAAQQARGIIEAATEIDGDEHAYLKRKGVLSFGLMLGEYRKGIKDALIVPARLADGTLVSVQAIFENASPMFNGRDRDYLPGGQKWGAMHVIGGKPAGETPVIVICEGYSTGASIHMATGYCVAVAFDAGNLRNVAVALREQYPMAVIIIAADDDRWHDDPNKPNDGVRQASQAASTTYGQVVVPKFANDSSKPTDFNDLHQLEGIDSVRVQINSALPKTTDDGAPPKSMKDTVSAFDFPHITSTGKAKNTAENLGYMLEQYGITARYNQIRKAVEVNVPGKSYTADNRANAALAEMTSLAARNGMPLGNLADYVKLLADNNAYNPVCDWVTSRPWDGVTRIQELLDTITTTGDTKLKNALMYRWLLSAIASVFMPYGFEGHGCLVLTGAQGTGKTTWFRRLVPSSLNLVMVGAMLDPADKDSVTASVSNWIVELGELDATFRKADIARLKSFIPKQVDKLRRPYDRVESEYQRRTVFGASVNDERYLVDDTGNRRWWTVPVLSIDYHHDLDMQQVWAELLTHFQRGEQHHLTEEENAALGSLNKEHEAIDPIEEIISGSFNWDDGPRITRMTASEVLIAVGYDKPSKAQATQASKILRAITGKEPDRKNSGRYFAMPARRGRASAANDNDTVPF